MLKKFLRTAAFAIASALLAGSAWSQPAAVPPLRPSFPQITLPDAKSHGQRAIELLGARLPEVAAWYGQNPLAFRAMLLRDRTNKIDRNGRWFVEEELQAPMGSASPEVTAGTLAPLADTFKLHSKPGSNRTIYLNFRGATLTNTAWNSGGGSIIAPPFHVDGEGAEDTNFTNNELTRIQYIWQRVAEDFAPFDVNVTTEQPAADALTRSSSTDLTFGTTALITKRAGVYNCSCGGVAYLFAFDDTSEFYKPALVFWDALGNSEKNVAEAISHEVGHNLGLEHDGTASVGYYQGHGSGVTGWAPIMGVGYYQNLVQWSKGEYSGANQKQDDIQVMQGVGLPLRADDHGNTTGSATALSAGTSATVGKTLFSGGGTIERSTDVDFFSFTAGVGSATITVSPSVRSANLDVLMRVYDASGTQLASANPLSQLNASVTVNLPSAGTYYVSVQGTGAGDPLATGYSAYGSLGFYAVSADVPTAATNGQPPVAVIAADKLSGTVPLTVTFSGAGSSDPDGTITAYNWTLGNGATSTASSVTTTYTTPGNYNVLLRVTDNSGNASTQTVTVSATQQVAAAWVDAIAMATRATRNNVNATASVTVRGGTASTLLPGAVVAGTWSGSVSGSTSGTVGSNGVVTFTSPNVKLNSTGPIVFTFTVNNITLSGYQYTPTANKVSSGTVQR